MRGFWAGVAVTVLTMAAFPALGRWIITTPYRTLAAYNQTAIVAPVAWRGAGGGGHMANGCPRALPARYAD